MRVKGQLLDLKGLRDYLQISQKELAEAVKRPASFISAIEHGKRSAPEALIQELVQIYEIPDISIYLSDPIPTGNGEVRNVKNSLVNSPGGVYTHTGAAVAGKGGTTIPHTSNTSVADSPTPSQVLHLLIQSENRLTEAKNRIRELEEEVRRLTGLLNSQSPD